MKSMALVGRRHQPLGIEGLEQRRLLAPVPELVADINPNQVNGSSPQFLTTTNDRLFFTAYPGNGGCGIWSTDGTTEGTLEACPPTPTRMLGQEPAFAAGTDRLFYVADQIGASWANELWVTEGTPESNVRLRTGVSPFSRLTVIGDKAYFRGEDAEHAIELWTSDGTVAGTRMIKDINPGTPYSSDPVYFTELNGNVYFAAVSPNGASVSSNDLWVTDGTADGTHVVATNSDGFNLRPQYMTRAGDKLFFRGVDAGHGSELWVSDGTSNGTHLVADLVPGQLGSSPTELTELNGQLYFVVQDANDVRSLWRTDGTEAGTIRVDSPPVSGLGTAVGDVLLFFARGPGEPRSSMWRTDGTPEGTFALPNPPGGNFNNRFVIVAGMAFVTVPLSNGRAEIWRTDGTPDGTAFVAEFTSASGASKSFASVGNQIFFVQKDEIHGSEVWRVVPPDGDTNFDGSVDLVDLNNVRNHFGESGKVLGDTNGDRHVDLEDLNAVRNNFGATSTNDTGVRLTRRLKSPLKEGMTLPTAGVDAVFQLLYANDVSNFWGKRQSRF